MREVLDKQKVIDALLPMAADCTVNDDRHFLYELGRKNAANFLLAEISLGHLDYE